MTPVPRVAGMPSWLTADLVLVILAALFGVKLRGRGRSEICARGEKSGSGRNGLA